MHKKLTKIELTSSICIPIHTLYLFVRHWQKKQHLFPGSPPWWLSSWSPLLNPGHANWEQIFCQRSPHFSRLCTIVLEWFKIWKTWKLTKLQIFCVSMALTLPYIVPTHNLPPLPIHKPTFSIQHLNDYPVILVSGHLLMFSVVWNKIQIYFI